MGSKQPLVAAVAPQQALPPVFTRDAAWPYFSFTRSLMLVSSTGDLLFADLHDVPRLEGFVPGATLGVEELHEFLKRFGIGGVAQEGAFAADVYEVFVFQFFEMMGKRGVGNFQLGLDIGDDRLPDGRRA